MGRSAVDLLLVSHRCPLAHPTLARAHPRLHHGSWLPLSHRHGCAFAPLGKISAAGARLLAISISTLRQTVGAGLHKALHPLVGSARRRPLVSLAKRHGSVALAF